MKFLMKISMPNELFSKYVKDGSIKGKMEHILGEVKPEAVYFASMHGKRTGILIVNMTEASQMPALAEPWFINFNAEVEFYPTMLPEDLGKADLEALGKKWG